MTKIGVGLYGTNGHQIQQALVDHPDAEAVAVAAFPEDAIPEPLRAGKALARYDTLEDLLRDDSVQLVSLCSPRRADQAADAVRCLEAGRDVYAEKPCALTEADLDRILETAARTGRRFHEMAGTAFDQPYLEMRTLVAEGLIGEVVQVYAQKSYPLHDKRPQDEQVDGGLTLQNGVHALRFVEHVAGVRAATIFARESQLGNPKPGGLRIASSMVATLENGGLASMVANYCNPPSFGSWGNECVRIFGTKGYLDASDGGQRTRLVLHDRDAGPLTPREPARPYHDRIFGTLLGRETMPLPPEEEVHPTRMVIRARDSARKG
ncbi:MAG: Gfo/Idh/MocA family protein [Planctomycetota bacterium]